MTGKRRGFGGLFEITTDEPKKESPRPAPTAAPRKAADTSEGPPVEISSIIPGAASAAPRRSAARAASSSTSVGDSHRVAQLVEDVQKHVPQENASLQLVNAMKSLEGIVEDPAARRTAAIKVLGTQGVTEESVMAGNREVAQAIDDRLNLLLSQSEDIIRPQNVTGKRTQAAALREQNAESNRQIEALRAQIADRERQATELEEEATRSDADLNQFKTEVETARIAAKAIYGI